VFDWRKRNFTSSPFTDEAIESVDKFALDLPLWIAKMGVHLNASNSLVVIWTPNAEESAAVKHEIDWFCKNNEAKTIYILCINDTPPPDFSHDNSAVRLLYVTAHLGPMLDSMDNKARHAEANRDWLEAQVALNELALLYRLHHPFVPTVAASLLTRRGHAERNLGAKYLAVRSFEGALKLLGPDQPCARINALLNAALINSERFNLISEVSLISLENALGFWKEALTLLRSHKSEFEPSEYDRKVAACDSDCASIAETLQASGDILPLLEENPLLAAVVSGDSNLTNVLLRQGASPRNPDTLK
jgi:tetratricopeptide (TPR) repeat protein